MTEALQTSLVCHSNGTSSVGPQMDVHVLSTSKEHILDVLRFTRGCGGREILRVIIFQGSALTDKVTVQTTVSTRSTTTQKKGTSIMYNS